MIQASVAHGHELREIAAQFHPGAGIIAIEPLGQGNVNDTFLVSLAGQTQPPLVLQRLNREVFRQPKLVMRNMQIVTRHVAARLQELPDDPAHNGSCRRSWEMPHILTPTDSADPWVERDGQIWRAMTYVPAARSLEMARDPAQAREVGYGLGMFHHLISDLPVDQLADTLEGFHITPTYLAQYHQLLGRCSAPPSPQEHWCQQFIESRQSLAPVLEEAKARGELQLRPIHGDPKINNVMLDAATGEAIALIDLDTVKPGLVHYDIGDCLRSCCNTLGEESRNPEAVQFDLGLCEALLEGYLSVARQFLTTADHQYLYAAIRLIAFELGLRFFSDHLAGNVYFKTSDPLQNLRRAQVQFRLVESIEAQEGPIRALLKRLGGA
ncbi:phosphotransferase [Synechococcus sp. CCY9201]|uniref:phosphotransferase enzyme family protein n=1 Tax=Synechococcus sp. CCY9201 TaxID=174697 RepID=UPI002B1F709B|nr:phosphotransferase [Synechococcus sp. CCY9201]MEA5475155.1 phosphotransferase [Synechococcus sp. CCY9201]